jgi:hypothetical protein
MAVAFPDEGLTQSQPNKCYFVSKCETKRNSASGKKTASTIHSAKADLKIDDEKPLIPQREKLPLSCFRFADLPSAFAGVQVTGKKPIVFTVPI